MSALGKLGLVICVIGACFALWGLAAWYLVRPTSIKQEMDPLALVQIGFTLLVGFYLTQYLSLRVTEKKAEKDILILYTREVLTSTHDALEALDELEGEPTQAKFQRALNRRLKILDVKVQGLTALFAECKIQGELPALVTEIGRTRLKFWRAATSAIPLAPRDRVAADSAFEHLLRQLTSLIIRINQLKP